MRLDDLLPAFVVLIFVGLFVALFYLIVQDKAEKERLIQQCIDDGRKEYECKSAFRKNSSTTFIPIFLGR